MTGNNLFGDVPRSPRYPLSGGDSTAAHELWPIRPPVRGRIARLARRCMNCKRPDVVDPVSGARYSATSKPPQRGRGAS